MVAQEVEIENDADTGGEEEERDIVEQEVGGGLDPVESDDAQAQSGGEDEHADDGGRELDVEKSDASLADGEAREEDEKLSEKMHGIRNKETKKKERRGSVAYVGGERQPEGVVGNGSDDAEWLKADGVCELDASGMEADAAVDVAASSPVLQVALDGASEV